VTPRVSIGRAAPWILLALPLLLVVALLVVPYLITFYYSVTNAQISALTNPKIIGLGNFQAIAASHAPALLGVLSVTFVFTLGTLIGSLGLGTGLALALHTMGPGTRAVLTAVFLIPWVVAGVIIGYTWRLMYDPQIGLASTLLTMVGAQPISFLTDRVTAIASLVVANIWASYGIVLLIMTGALANLPPNLILSGQIDGASYGRIVRKIILPAVRPSFLLAGLVALVSGLNVFDLIYVMTGGGPVYQTETLALEMFRVTQKRGDIGQGAALTVILFSLSLLLAIAYVFVWRREARKWS
jgi:multiple sugar transport system permease protein